MVKLWWVVVLLGMLAGGGAGLYSLYIIYMIYCIFAVEPPIGTNAFGTDKKRRQYYIKKTVVSIDRERSHILF